MAHKFNEIVRFSYFLPYGFASPSAAILGINMPEIAHMAYSPKIPMSKRLAAYERAHDAAIKQLNFMKAGGYIKASHRKYGNSKTAQVRVLSLTKSGLYLLTNTPDKEEETRRLELNRANETSQPINYRSRELNDVASRNYLYSIYSKEDASEEEIQIADDLLYRNIISGNMSVLTCGIAVAQEVSCTPLHLNSEQFYRCWRASNVNALFMANNFLTYLDRRPMDTKWQAGKMRSQEDFSHAQLDGNLDIPALVYGMLTNWYEHSPESYSFLNPHLDLNSISPVEWETTPAFYQVSELPGMQISDIETLAPLTGAANAVRNIYDGIAVGKKETYIVHHTRPERTPWNEKTERKTTALVSACLKNNYPGFTTRSKQEIDHAIIVCDTVHQFAALFRNAKDNMPKRWRKVQRVGAPYDTVSIVPINASGAMQLRILLLSSPYEFESMIIRTFIAQNTTSNPLKFEITNDSVFQLMVTRKKEDQSGSETFPVLLAHSMDFQRLYYAWEKYNEGTKFVVGCYPGQVKYIRKIMPNVEFI